jgi:hypothetical protein
MSRMEEEAAVDPTGEGNKDRAHVLQYLLEVLKTFVHCISLVRSPFKVFAGRLSHLELYSSDGQRTTDNGLDSWEEMLRLTQ